MRSPEGSEFREGEQLKSPEILDGREAKDLFESLKEFRDSFGNEVMAATDTGHGKKKVNEDRVLFIPELNFGAVVDGISSGLNGAEAAQILAEELQSSPRDISKATQRALQRIIEAGEEFDEHSGACFITARIFEKEGRKKLEVWQQGDCSVLVFSKTGVLKFQSDDQTFAQVLVENKAITPDQALFNARRHVVTSAVTLNSKEVPKTYDLSKLNLEPGDRIFIMSDGIGDNLTPEEIWQATEEMNSKDAVSALSLITTDRAMNVKKIEAETGGPEGRAAKGVYADGYRSEPKADNRALLIIDIAA